MNVDKVRKAIGTIKEVLNCEDNIEIAFPALTNALETSLQALTKQLVNQKTFEWRKCTRKNGTQFLKLIYYSNDVGGYIEVGRYNMSKHEYIQNNWHIAEILRELEG